MRYRKKDSVFGFFDVSIIMPFYKRLNDFKEVLPKNAPFFQRNGIEVLLLLDGDGEESGVLKLIGNYPFINFKIVVNRKKHKWRNPCKVLNVGIKQASFKYILVLDPEVELVNDVVHKLRYVLHNYPKAYATGVVAFIDHKDPTEKMQNPHWMPYGSIMATREDMVKIRGYDEDFEKWGGEDDQIRRKLDLLGLQKIELTDAKAVHREHNSDGHRSRSSRIDKMPIRHLKKILYPRKTTVNKETWGQDFDEIVFNWANDKNFSSLNNYVNAFDASYIRDEQVCTRDFELIALVQIRNESRNVPEILMHLDKYCDGILLLDDGSTDGSYQRARHGKLLVKVRKGYDGYFDDLKNRNILLRIASFFKSKWFFFIDADERFDPRHCDLRKHVKDAMVDVYQFNLVDLWDNEDTYRVDIPKRDDSGITSRARMFRNRGNLQIYSNREIHFPSVPYFRNVRLSQILLLHYGNFDKRIRNRKYQLYTSQDSDGIKQGYLYNYLKDDKVVLKKLEDIQLQENQGTASKSGMVSYWDSLYEGIL